MKKTLTVAMTAATLLLVSACGGGDEEPDDTPGGQETTAADDSGDETDEPEDEASEPAAGGVLTAMVGTEDDPEAFEISLVDESGNAVTEIPAGDYTINVIDPATTHNFHLTGGSVDETTGVDEVTEVTWEVTFEAGDYTFTCDPHPNMTGEFTVT